MSTFKTLIRICLVGALMLTFAPWALAISNGDISVSPAKESDSNDPRTQSWFIYNFLPGTNHIDQVLVKNESDQARTLKIYAVDGYTTEQGGFALRSITDPKQSIGKWISLSKSELTIQPGREIAVDFTYTVPKDAEPGEYAGGIVVEDTMQIQGQGVAVIKRVGVRMYHDVPGDRDEKIVLISSEMKETASGRYFEALVENTGNVSMSLKLEETVFYKDGGVAAVLVSPEQTVLPKSKVLLKTQEWQNPYFGSFNTKGSVKKGEEVLGDTPTYSFMVVSPFIFAALGIVILLVLVLVTRLRKCKKTKRKKHKK